MGRLIPDVDPEDILLKPERDVARALVRDLPDDCLIYHSYCWLRPDRDYQSEPLLEGEADFLVLDPRYGLLVIEVKGGDIRHRVENDTELYYRLLSQGRRKDLPKHPFRQASGNLHAIEEILKLREEPYWFGGCRGYAVAFPDSQNVGQLPNDVDPSIVFFAEHLDDYDRAVRGAFRSWNRIKTPSISPDAMRRCRQELRPIFHLLPARWRSMERDEEQLVRLTEQQQIVLNGLRDNRRLAVCGGAGTGKTMLALWQSVEFAREGKETLFLCFNKALAQWLNSRIATELDQDLRRRLTISTFHSLCASFFSKAKIPFQPPTDSDERARFWQTEVPDKMFDRVIDLVPEPRFDAMVIDEAQDFADDWWLTVESLSRNANGPLCIFYDPNQNLFHKESTLPATDATYRLSINCRNTRQIHAFSMTFLDAKIQSSPMVPEGVTPTRRTASSESQQRAAIDEIIKQWKSEYRLKSSQFAILASSKRENTCLASTNRTGGMAITENPEQWRAGEGVLYSTISGFKGLESEAVILLSSADHSHTNELDRYVATSRARHLLAVIDAGE